MACLDEDDEDEFFDACETAMELDMLCTVSEEGFDAADVPSRSSGGGSVGATRGRGARPNSLDRAAAQREQRLSVELGGNPMDRSPALMPRGHGDEFQHLIIHVSAQHLAEGSSDAGTGASFSSDTFRSTFVSLLRGSYGAETAVATTALRSVRIDDLGSDVYEQLRSITPSRRHGCEHVHPSMIVETHLQRRSWGTKVVPDARARLERVYADFMAEHVRFAGQVHLVCDGIG